MQSPESWEVEVCASIKDPQTMALGFPFLIFIFWVLL